ncbi:tRNA (adenosine(37)-N6)-threonylcarbamoyltransferase complex dimerization subunit type 1 TsaB [Corynebacterium sp. NPDC060344]|uniref:tRNA (adenosine(37)-N6)-threonylcarbamoyltransferase complex dimerization subunit type 1 TsaB n=1 Tax=Corynebacterium sp. NPDC060344 TaxID=3347101 RepID=UPI003660BFA5
MFVLAVDTSTPQVTAGLVRVAELPGAGLAAGAVAPILEEIAAAGHVDARAHNEVLTPLIRRCLDDAGLSGAAAAEAIGAVVVGCGPGPFTGLRVGMATAASFADACGVPAHGACSLDALAHPAGEALRGDVMAVTDARRREVYVAAYRDGQRIWGPAVMSAAACSEAVTEDVPDFEPAHLVGDEAKCADVAAGFGATDTAGATSGPSTASAAPRITAAYPTPAGLIAAAIAELEHEHDEDGPDADGDGEPDHTPFRATAALTAPAAPLVPLYLRRPDATPPKPKPKSPAIPDVGVAKQDAP